MDPINIIAGLNLILSFSANLAGAKLGLKSTVSPAKIKPKTYLQKVPLYLSTLTLILFIISLFQVGTADYSSENQNTRIAGLIIYIIFSWLQIYSYRSLKTNYSQDIVIYKHHQLVTTGIYRYIRHPQYLSQLMMDIGGMILTLSYLMVLPVFIQIPILVLRARLEDEIHLDYFKDKFIEYKTKSGFMFPFWG